MEEKDQGEKIQTGEREREREDGGWKRDGTIDSVIFRKSRAFVDDSSFLSLFPIRKANNRVKKKEEKKKVREEKKKMECRRNSSRRAVRCHLREGKGGGGGG